MFPFQSCIIINLNAIVKMHHCKPFLAHCGPYIGFETFKTTDATLTGATGDRKGTNNT